MAIIYDLLQWTWGLPQTFLGFIYFLINIKQEHYYYHGSVVTLWKSKSSLSGTMGELIGRMGYERVIDW